MKKYFFLVLLCTLYNQLFAQHNNNPAYEIKTKWISDSTVRVNLRFTQHCSGPTIDSNNFINFYNRFCFYDTLNPNIVYNGPSYGFPSIPGMYYPSTLENGFPNGQEIRDWCPNTITTCDTGAVNSGIYSYRIYEAERYFHLPYNSGVWRFIAKSGGGNEPRDTTPTNLQHIAPASIYGKYYYFVESGVNMQNPNEHNANSIMLYPSPYYVVAGRTQTLNFSAIDTDGDSLVYHLDSTKSEAWGYNLVILPNTPGRVNVPFEGSLSLQEPFHTGGTWHLDSLTGIASFTATSAQRPLLTLVIDEYRNGVWMGKTLRDLVVTVLPANNDPNPTFQIMASTFVNTTQSGIDSLYVCPNIASSFCLGINSSNQLAQLKVEHDLAQALPSATVSYTNHFTDSVKACIAWTPSLSDTGWHTFIITTKDTTCETSIVHPWLSKVYRIKVQSPTKSICWPASISQYANEAMSQLVVYPNPAQNVLQVRNNTKSFEYQIQDVCGRKLQEGIFNQSISISDLANGVYFLKTKSQSIMFSVQK